MAYNLSAANGLVPGFGTQKSNNATNMFSELGDMEKATEFRLAGAALDAGAQREFDKIQLKMMELGAQPQKKAGGFDWMGLAKTGLGIASGLGAFGGGGGGGLGDLGAGISGGSGGGDFAGVPGNILDDVLKGY